MTSVQVESALNAVPTIGGTGALVRVIGSQMAGTYHIAFRGALLGAPVPNLIASAGTISEIERDGLG